MSGISIRQLQESDWKILREIRLKALLSDPAVFGSNHEDESRKSEAQWRMQLAAPDCAIFGVFDGDRSIGITGVAIHRDDPAKKTAILWSSWLEPEARGKSLSKMIYDVRLDWARGHPSCEKIVVSHRASNVASMKANRRHGFVFTHKIMKEWPDGTVDDELFYELDLGR